MSPECCALSLMFVFSCMIMSTDYKVFLIFSYFPTHVHAQKPAVTNPHILTIQLGSEAESVIALVLFVPVAIVTNTSGSVPATTLVSGMCYRVLH